MEDFLYMKDLLEPAEGKEGRTADLDDKKYD